MEFMGSRSSNFEFAASRAETPGKYSPEAEEDAVNRSESDGRRQDSGLRSETNNKRCERECI